jgi:DNA-binding HxlR family transcriptional regulator
MSVKAKNNYESINCPIDLCIEIVKGKCKAAILLKVDEGLNRFNHLRRNLDISQRILARQLNELIQDNILSKTVIVEKPLHIEYKLTELGSGLIPIVTGMLKWGSVYRSH